MNIFLKHVRKAEFLDARNQWNGRGKALRFASGAQAVMHCLRTDLHDAEIFYEFDGSQFSFAVPMAKVGQKAA